LSSIGDMLAAADRTDEALAQYQESLAIIEKLALGDPGNPLWQRDLTLGENKLGDLFAAAGRWDEALSAYRKGLAIRARLVESDPGNAERQYDLAFSYGRVGQALVGAQQLAAPSPSSKGWPRATPTMSSGRAPCR
jgi:tetratricopeptide (TPR) repeat protein